MGWWQVNADTLAGSRFVVSQLAETIAGLKVLERGTAGHPGERAWLAAHLSAYRARQAADPVGALLIRAALGPTWNADFLTPTPEPDEAATFEDEVARVREAAPGMARQDLTVSLGGPLPPLLHRDDLPQRAADTLEWVWRETVLPYWARRRQVIEADVVARTAQLSQGGWAAALDDMRPGMRWLGESRLQINARYYPPRDLSGARLMFVPVTPRHGWVSWEEGPLPGTARAPAAPAPAPGSREGAAAGPGGVVGRSDGGRPASSRALPRYAVTYPCSGVLVEAAEERVPVPEALGALLGGARAAVLVLLDTPKSTSQLVALTGQGLGSVGRHLRVLLDARLLRRRRAGRSVLYYRTAVGDTLVRAQAQAEAQAEAESGSGSGSGTGLRSRPGPGLARAAASWAPVRRRVGAVGEAEGSAGASPSGERQPGGCR
ncbi:transcriptional regulator [Streptomyces sp. NBC_01186]|uniref:transcriptional regulator n=1 Tax=Streptomyces sp. NBC_01186 TaxID=2903765 RepID=UPI002E0F800B|nr:transcriptional regulator [Streptomyces sp. NBC_01186]